MNRWVLASLVAVASIGLIWFGTQIIDQDHGADPGGKLFLASWLSSQLWINPWLIGIGLAGLVVALLVLLFGRGTSSRETA